MDGPEGPIWEDRFPYECGLLLRNASSDVERRRAELRGDDGAGSRKPDHFVSDTAKTRLHRHYRVLALLGALFVLVAALHIVIAARHPAEDADAMNVESAADDSPWGRVTPAFPSWMPTARLEGSITPTPAV